MTETTKGACLCGAARYAFDGPVKFAIQCYCRDCQHVSGGGHLPQVAVARDSFSFSGAVKTYSQKSDAGSDLHFSFCGGCGSPLFKATSKAPDLIFIYAGSLDEPPDAGFDRKVFETSRQPWDTC